MTAATLSASELACLIRPVLSLAGDGSTPPVLNAVLLGNDNGFLTATATDRYRLGVARHEATVDAGFSALVPLAAIKRILAMFKARRSYDPALRLTVSGGDKPTLTVATIDGLSDGVEMSATFPLEVGKYPDLPKLLRKIIKESATAKRATPAVNIELLAGFRYAGGPNAPLEVRVVGNNRPILLIGENFIGMQMPVRSDANAQAADLGSWALLAEPAEKAEVAS